MSQLDPKAKAGTFRAPLALPTAPTETRVAKDTPDDGKTVAAGKTIYAAFDSKNEGSVLATVTDDTVIDDNSMPVTFKGTKGAKDYVNGFWKAFPDFKQDYPVRFAAGDVLLTEGVFTGTQSGPMGPLKATNKPVTYRFVDVMQIKDGKIARVDSFGDSAEILVAVGAMPALGAPPAAAMAAATPAPAAKPK
jgi:predicted ester cyclase